MQCVDGSAESLHAFKYLIHGLVNVGRGRCYRMTLDTSGDNIILFSVQEEKETVEAVEDRLGKFIRLLATVERDLKLNSEGGVHYKVISVKDSSAKKKIGQSILATADAEKVDFLVMGTRSASVTKAGKLHSFCVANCLVVLGSISQYVLKHSKVPVVVAPQ